MGIDRTYQDLPGNSSRDLFIPERSRLPLHTYMSLGHVFTHSPSKKRSRKNSIARQSSSVWNEYLRAVVSIETPPSQRYPSRGHVYPPKLGSEKDIRKNLWNHHLDHMCQGFHLYVSWQKNFSSLQFVWKRTSLIKTTMFFGVPHIRHQQNLQGSFVHAPIEQRSKILMTFQYTRWLIRTNKNGLLQPLYNWVV